MTQLYDISPVVSPRTAVFPGDTPYTREVSLDFERGDNLVLSSVRTTVHVGAHADAPSHYHRGGIAIEARALDRYLGPCHVMTVAADAGPRIAVEELPDSPQAPRVLLHTDSYPDPEVWTPTFRALSVELVEHLAEAGVILVGIDTPSVDPADDSILHAHAAIAQHDLAVLEGLVLSGVPDGLYELIALPLRLEGADASPVRAVLRTMNR